MTDYRALCAELIRQYLGIAQFERLTPEQIAAASHCQELQPVEAALLADVPAVPEGREPASVVGELLGLDQLEATWNAQADAANGWDELGLDEIIVWAQRQALARWGYHPTPPAEGEAMRRLIDAPIDARWYVDLRNAPTTPAEGEVQPQELPDDFIGHERGFAQEHLARLMRDAIGTETDHSAYIVAAGKILDRPEFALVASRGRRAPVQAVAGEGGVHQQTNRGSESSLSDFADGGMPLG